MNNELKDQMRLQYWAVAFIDLLGQSEKMATMTAIPPNPTDDEMFMEAIRGTFLAVRDLQTACRDMFDSFCNREPAVELPPGISVERYKELIRSEIRFQRFSDGLVAFVSLDTNNQHLPMNGITGLLATIGTQMPAFLATGRPFRCGIDIGLGVEMQPGELYGPALRNAYLLESKVAQYPRIVIGNGLVNYLKSALASDDGTSLDGGTTRVLAKRWLDALITDVDGHVILDYLGKPFISGLAGVESKKEVMSKARDFAEREQDRFRKAQNSKLAFRYATLHSYFEYNRPNWEQ